MDKTEQIRKRESLWRQTVQLEERAALTGDMETEVAVIGAGIAGILTAFFLWERGYKVTVLEADRIGSGQTENTTAKITSQHGLIYHRLIAMVGREKAKQYADANQKAIAEFRNMIERNQIECQFESCPAYLYSQREYAALIKEAEAARSLGIHAEFTTETELPFPVKGAVKFHNQARFHPLEFIRAIAERITVYEQTKVIKVKNNMIYTEKGTVKAEHIVFTSHFPFLNVPGFYFLRMHQERSIVTAFRHADRIEGVYYGIDKEDGYSLRSSGDYLFVGGENYRTGKSGMTACGMHGDRYQKLENYARQFWPDCEKAAEWSAQDCITLDGIPYIGRFCRRKPNWYVATGFGKWGMSSAMVSAMRICELIEGGKSSYPNVFSPQRLLNAVSVYHLLLNFGNAIRNLTRQLFSNPRTRCPHLGCKLAWNEEEQTWDCPCHGSRFRDNGVLLNNPAQEDMRHE